MLIRKAASAYFAAFAGIICLALNIALHDGSDADRFGSFAGWLVLAGLYAFPIALVYGSLVSIGTDLILNRRRWPRILKHLLSGLGHIAGGWIFGALFFSLFGGESTLRRLMYPDGFTWACIGTAAFFFAADRLLVYWQGKRTARLRYPVLLVVPIAVAVAILVSLHRPSPPLPPFEAADAVSLATAGDINTVTDRFPDEEGTVRTSIDGYDVSLSTKAVPLGAGKYEVTFTEHWTGGDQQGSYWYAYVVERNGVTLSGKGGDRPPYL